jgi:HAD superfamily hydrolase (TIGR01509 family)
MILGIVFDFDGLILETERPQYEAWRDVFASFDRPLPLQAWLDVMGKPVQIDLFPRRLSAELGRDMDIDALIAQYREVVAQHLDAQPIQPGVERIIQDARALGLKMAVASGSTHRWVDGHLQRLGLFGSFDHTTCSEDTEKHKPDPDPYLHACRALGINPGSSLALEDSALGVTAAKAASMHAVAVPTEMTGYQSFEHADLQLNSLDQLSLAEMIERLGERGRPGGLF